MALPGIYVPIKGDYSALEKSLKEAKAIVTNQATGISNALNNALSPSSVRNNIDSLVRQFTTLERASKMSGKVFSQIGVDLGELRKITGLTDEQFASLQSRLLKTQAANAQEAALKRLAKQLDLTEKEIRDLGSNFNISTSGVDRVVSSLGKVDGVVEKSKKRMDLFGGSVAMAAGKFILLEQAAYSVQRIINAVAFDFNATVETATMGIAAAFLNNGEYTDQITGKVLRGQEAMSAAMDDADSVIQRLKASNLQTIATLDQLIKAYQEAAPVALSKGFNKDQVEQFTVAMMQAAGAVDTTGMLIGQMGEEIRSVLTGGINPKNTRIATALGITNQDIARYEGDIQGLFDFLMSKLDAYKTFGEQLQKTWSGVASNTVDVLQQVSAQATDPLFEAIRDGLYDWQQGIAKINKETGLLEWNPEYQQGIEKVRDTIESLVDLVSSNKDAIGAMFDAAGWAALQSLDGINQVLTLLGNVVSTAKVAIQEIKNLTGISVDIPKPWDIPGAMINGAKQVNLKWSELNDEWSGKRDSKGDLTNATAEELAVDRLKQKIKGLKQELSVKENSITGLIFGNRAPEDIQNDIKATESQLKDLEGRLKETASKATWSPSIKVSADEQEMLDKKIEEMQKAADKANKAAEEYVRTAKESAIAKFDEMTKYLAPGSDLMLKAQAKLNEELAEIDEREARSGRTAAMRGEREELKQLNATIKGYVAEARNAAEISDEWNKSAMDTIEAMTRLNDEITMSGLGEFGRAAYDMGRQLQEGGDEIDKFNARLAEAKEQAENTKAWYEAVGAQLEEAQGKLGGNSAGSSVEDANKVRELADQHQRLGESLKEQTVIYQKLLDLEANGRITSRDQLEQELAAQRKYDALISAYHEIGRVSEETFSLISAHEDAEKFNFIQATGDKELAYRLFSERMLEYRRAFAADQYEKTGSVGALMDVGLSSYQSNMRDEAVKFYEDVLPKAIDQSSDALGKFARNAAESNMSLSEAWENLGKTISDVVFDILQDLTALSVKMAIMGTLGASGGEGSMATWIGSLLGSLFTANAQGNVYASPGLSAYSNTVVSSPTIFPFAKGIGLMGEAGSEAIMPLTRMPGGDLGVKAQSSSPNINVTVNNNSSAQASARVEQSQDGMSWDVIVDMVEQKMQSRINQGRQGVGKRGPMI